MAEMLRYETVKVGGPMEVSKAPRPAVKASDEVLVKVKTVALQPLDWKRLYYGFMVESWPAVFGIDGAGIVEEVGSDVKNFKPGDEVFGLLRPAFQEYVVINETRLAQKPDSWTAEDAASLPVVYVTAAASLYTGLGMALPYLEPYGGPKEGFQPKSVLVLGGSSAVGASVIQLLRIAAPNTTIITTSSEKHHNHLKALGADTTFDRSASADEIRAATPGSQGVDGIVDTVGAVTGEPSMLEIFDPAGDKKFSDVATGANLEKIPDGIDRVTIYGAEVLGKPGGNGVFAALPELIESGKFKLPVATKIVGQGLEVIRKGLDELKAGVSGTKLVVKV